MSEISGHSSSKPDFCNGIERTKIDTNTSRSNSTSPLRSRAPSLSVSRHLSNVRYRWKHQCTNSNVLVHDLPSEVLQCNGNFCDSNSQNCNAQSKVLVNKYSPSFSVPPATPFFESKLKLGSDYGNIDWSKNNCPKSFNQNPRSVVSLSLEECKEKTSQILRLPETADHLWGLKQPWSSKLKNQNLQQPAPNGSSTSVCSIGCNEEDKSGKKLTSERSHPCKGTSSENVNKKGLPHPKPSPTRNNIMKANRPYKYNGSEVSLLSSATHEPPIFSSCHDPVFFSSYLGFLQSTNDATRKTSNNIPTTFRSNSCDRSVKKAPAAIRHLKISFNSRPPKWNLGLRSTVERSKNEKHNFSISANESSPLQSDTTINSISGYETSHALKNESKSLQKKDFYRQRLSIFRHCVDASSLYNDRLCMAAIPTQIQQTQHLKYRSIILHLQYIRGIPLKRSTSALHVDITFAGNCLTHIISLPSQTNPLLTHATASPDIYFLFPFTGNEEVFRFTVWRRRNRLTFPFSKSRTDVAITSTESQSTSNAIKGPVSKTRLAGNKHTCVGECDVSIKKAIQAGSCFGTVFMTTPNDIKSAGSITMRSIMSFHPIPEPIIRRVPPHETPELWLEDTNTESKITGRTTSSSAFPVSCNPTVTIKQADAPITSNSNCNNNNTSWNIKQKDTGVINVHPVEAFSASLSSKLKQSKLSGTKTPQANSYSVKDSASGSKNLVGKGNAKVTAVSSELGFNSPGSFLKRCLPGLNIRSSSPSRIGNSSFPSEMMSYPLLPERSPLEFIECVPTAQVGSITPAPSPTKREELEFTPKSTATSRWESAKRVLRALATKHDFRTSCNGFNQLKKAEGEITHLLRLFIRSIVLTHQITPDPTKSGHVSAIRVTRGDHPRLLATKTRHMLKDAECRVSFGEKELKSSNLRHGCESVFSFPCTDNETKFGNLKIKIWKLTSFDNYLLAEGSLSLLNVYCTSLVTTSHTSGLNSLKKVASSNISNKVEIGERIVKLTTPYGTEVGKITCAIVLSSLPDGTLKSPWVS